MGPGAHQPGALKAEGRQFDLQHTLAGAGPVAKDFQDQPGTVKKLDVPLLFQIALLYRRDRAVDQNQTNVGLGKAGLELVDLAFAEQQARLHPCQPDHLGPRHFDPRQRCGQRHGLGQPMFGQPPRAVGFYVGMQHPGAQQTHAVDPFGATPAFVQQRVGGVVGLVGRVSLRRHKD